MHNNARVLSRNEFLEKVLKGMSALGRGVWMLPASSPKYVNFWHSDLDSDAI